MIEQRSKAQGKRPEFCPIKRQRIVAGLLLAFVFFVNAIAGIAAREGGLAFLQHEKLAQSIVRNSSHWLREDIGSWHVFETNTWLVGRVRSHVGSLERSLSDFGYTSVREQVELATRYVYRMLSQEEVKLRFKRDVKLRVAYHTPCHMEKLGWAYYSIELLKLIPNVELTVLDSQCCGIAGTYGFKKENYETSQHIGESLFRQIEESGADYVVTDCETCKWQIEMSTTKRCEHPISILAMALE